MLINGKEIDLDSLDYKTVNSITPFKENDPGETDAVIDIEGTRFYPSYDFEEVFDELEEDEELEQAMLECVYLRPVPEEGETLDVIEAWKNRIMKKYDLEYWDYGDESPYFNYEILLPGGDWRIKASIRADSGDYDLMIIKE